MVERYVDKEYFLGKIDAAIVCIEKELLKARPKWCPSRIYLWWLALEAKRVKD